MSDDKKEMDLLLSFLPSKFLDHVRIILTLALGLTL